MEGNNNIADLIKLILYIWRSIIFISVNLPSGLQLLLRQEALDELEFIIDNSVECMGSTA